MSATVERPPDTEGPAATRLEAPVCPNCGAPAAAGQLMCLECGGRIGLDHARPASWKIAAAIVGAVVLLAGAVLAVALIEVTDDADTRSRAPAPTQALGSTPATAPAATGTAPAPTGTTPAAPGTAPESSTPAPAEGDRGGETIPEASPAPPPAATGGEEASATAWPDGKSAHTVILASEGSRQEAEAKRRRARQAGISAGILRSGDFPSLRPGYWVVFDGQFDSAEQATARAEEDRRKGFPDAYPRFVDPR